MNFEDIFQTYEKFVEYSVSKTDLATRGEDLQNIKESGGMTEEIIRNFFCQFIPKRYAVTSGYIIRSDSQDKRPIVSDQLDMIIVDTLVPHSFYTLDDKSSVQVVPWECVVGVFEIKRTLTKKTFETALIHLKKLVGKNIFSKEEKLQHLAGGISLADSLKKTEIGSIEVFYDNPIFGILSLNNDPGITKTYLEEKTAEIRESKIDIIFSLSGLLHSTIIKDTKKLCFHPPKSYKDAEYNTLINRSFTLSGMKEEHVEKIRNLIKKPDKFYSGLGPTEKKILEDLKKKILNFNASSEDYKKACFSITEVEILERFLTSEEEDSLTKLLLKPEEKLKIISKGIGYLQYYVQKLNGRMSKTENYFFNKKIFPDG